MKVKVKITIECEHLPFVLVHEVECDHLDKETPCMANIYQESIKAADDFVSQGMDKAMQLAREAAFELLAKEGGEQIEP